MASLFTSRDGAIRLYSTTHFLELVFEDGNLSFPLGLPRPEERPILNRGRMDVNAHYITGPDRVLDGLPFTFSFKLANAEPTRQKLRDILDLDSAATWTVAGVTLITTKATTQVISGGPSPALVTTPAFADPRKRTTNLQFLLTDPVNGGTADIGHRLNECFYPPEQNTQAEADDGVTWSVNGICYGSIEEITAFTAGTALD